VLPRASIGFAGQSEILVWAGDWSFSLAPVLRSGVRGLLLRVEAAAASSLAGNLPAAWLFETVFGLGVLSSF